MASITTFTQTIVSSGKNPTLQHSFFILLLFIIPSIFFHSLYTDKQIPDNIHYIDNLAFPSHSIVQGVFQYHDFPLWDPYTFGGNPLIAIPEHALFDLNILLLLLSRNVYLSMNLALMLYVFLAGFGMYLLTFSLTDRKSAAFIAALIYTFNGFMHSFLLTGHINLIMSYSYIPFIILWCHLSLTKELRMLPMYSFLAGLFLALQIFAGGIIFFLYTGILVGCLFFFHLATKLSLSTLWRLMASGTILLCMTIGISAVKLLPILEYTSLSNRSGGVSFQEYLGYPIDLHDWWHLFVYNHPFQGFNASVGIIGAILMIAGFGYYKKRYVLFSLFIIALSLFLASGSQVATFFYHYLPGFEKMRHIERAVVFFMFGASLLAAFGAKFLFAQLEKYTKSLPRVLFIVLVALIYVDNIHFQPPQKTIAVVPPENLGILQFLSGDEDSFRIINLGLKEYIGSSGYVYYSQKGIRDIKGGGGIWLSTYPEPLVVAGQTAQSKFWGLLNIKYIISDTEVSIPGTSFVGTYPVCGTCPIPIAYGPYLYENEQYLPRAYMVNTSILIVGDPQNVKDITYFLMLNANSTVAFVKGGASISSYSPEDLRRYSAIILAKNSVDQSGAQLLKSYKNSGGQIFPDVIGGKNALTTELLADVSRMFTSTLMPINMVRSSPDELVLDTQGATGMLLLSEPFAYYPGWTSSDGQHSFDLLSIDNFLTGVYVKTSSPTITFAYRPSSFSRGLFITFFTLLISAGYGTFMFVQSRKSHSPSPSPEGKQGRSPNQDPVDSARE